jgi:tetrahydromethanopterin S-methyltransferase subunit H
MFKFKREQKVFDIAGIKVGGQPGERQTVLIGSMFYHGHKIVEDEKTGKFQKEKAEKLIKLQEEFSDKTKNPFMVDVVGSTEEAIQKFLQFIGDFTDAPILIDSPSFDVKIAGVKCASEAGLRKRVVYNSLVPESKPNEFQAIRESHIENCVLLAYESGFMTSDARVKAMRKLVLRAEEAGVTRCLLDAFVMDIPSLSMACRAILDLKREYGLPCGCGAHNAVSTWAGLKERMGVQAVLSCAVAVNIAPIVLGADFILYGPMEDCKYVFPAVYAIDTSYKYLYRMKEQMEI